jgi:hypothetical protein
VSCVGILSSSLLADGEAFRRDVTRNSAPNTAPNTAPGRFEIVGGSSTTEEILAQRGGVTMRELSRLERAHLDAGSLSTSAAFECTESDGGGALISDLELVQVAYESGDCIGNCRGVPCACVLLVWLESEPETSPIRVIINGETFGFVEPLPAASVPGRHGVIVSGFEPGTHRLAVASQDNASMSEVSIAVVREQPFSDPTDLSCEEAEGGAADCNLVVRWQNGETSPENYGMIVDGFFVALVDGSSEEFVFEDIGAGEHRVSIGGLTGVGGRASYRGCFLDATCPVACAGGVCRAPSGLLLCQISHGPEPGDNLVQAYWTNTQGVYPGGILGFVDDQHVGTLSGPANDVFGFFDDLSLGVHRIGVQGDCGGGILSDRTEESIEILESTPHQDPVEGPILCRYDAWTMTTTARWRAAEESVAILVWVRRGGENLFAGVIPGDFDLVTVTPTLPDDQVALQFLLSYNDECHGSRLIDCSPEVDSARFIPGICNGASQLDISSPVFLLGFLFLGGPRPPCLVACDSNGDLVVDVSDAVHTLDFLFVGGPAPTGSIDDLPVCLPSGDVLDCDFGNPACAG